MESCSTPRVSVIIPFYREIGYLRECLEHCLRLDYPNYEIIVVSSLPLNLDLKEVKCITIDSESQGVKKDVGVAHATGEICAFIDDDAYPTKSWIKNAIKYFSDERIAAVCGPGLTPPNDNPRQVASGVIYSSVLGSGPLRLRYVPTKPCYLDEVVGYNLFVRRSVLLKVNGFSTNLRSGEDTLLSHKIKKLGLRLFYAPDVIVYHHRRPLFLPHLRQVRNYALHRGFFAKTFKGTSLSTLYFLPLLSLTLVMLTLIVTSVLNLALQMTLMIIVFYLLYGFVEGLRARRGLSVALLTCIGLPLTHLTYVIGLIHGLLTKSLGERPSH